MESDKMGATPNMKSIEELQQQMFELNRTYANKMVYLQDLEIESEKLRKQLATIDEEINKQNDEHCSQIVCLREEINRLVSELEEENEINRKLVVKHEEEIKIWKSKMSAANQKESDPECEKLNEALLENQDIIERLKMECTKLKSSHEKLESEKSETILKLHENVDEMKQIIERKTESLQSVLQSLESIQEEKALLTTELSILKTGPVDELHGGNSLFSEVEDKRQQMAQKYNILKNKYACLKRDWVKQKTELREMMDGNAKLYTKVNEMESAETTIKGISNTLVMKYEERIRGLENQIKKLELRPESPEEITIKESDLSQMSRIHAIVNKEKREARETVELFPKYEAEKLVEAGKLYRAQLENERLKCEKSNILQKIAELELKLSSLQQPNVPEDCKTENDPIDEVNQTVKRDDTQKTVRFTEETKPS